jgi:hypothetical protein
LQIRAKLRTERNAVEKCGQKMVDVRGKISIRATAIAYTYMAWDPQKSKSGGSNDQQ